MGVWVFKPLIEIFSSDKYIIYNVRKLQNTWFDFKTPTLIQAWLYPGADLVGGRRAPPPVSCVMFRKMPSKKNQN